MQLFALVKSLWVADKETGWEDYRDERGKSVLIGWRQQRMTFERRCYCAQIACACNNRMRVKTGQWRKSRWTTWWSKPRRWTALAPRHQQRGGKLQVNSFFLCFQLSLTRTYYSWFMRALATTNTSVYIRFLLPHPPPPLFSPGYSYVHSLISQVLQGKTHKKFCYIYTVLNFVFFYA